MGTLNKKEKELLSEIVESIEDELSAISEGFANNDRLAYLTCLNDNEKLEYTKQEIRKLQEGFKVCKPDISEYIFSLIQKHPSDISTIEEKLKQIIRNFILDQYSEAFELLMKPDNIKSLPETSFRECIEGLKFETGLLDEFIRNVANAIRFLSFSGLIIETQSANKDINPEPKNAEQNLYEIIDSYFKNLRLLGISMSFLVNKSLPNNLSYFEKLFKITHLAVSIDYLCKCIEVNLLNNPIEHNEKLFNIITNKINYLESYLYDEELIKKYNELRGEKIYINESYSENIHVNKLLFIGKAFPLHEDTPKRLWYGTPETFYNATLHLFNTGKSRINDLFNGIQPLISRSNSDNTENKTSANPYPRIFKNHECFLFFESLKRDVRERYILADYSFIYRRMQKDGYIFNTVLDAEFRDFIQKIFSIEIDKTKLLDYCKTEQKENNYKTKKGLFQHL